MDTPLTNMPLLTVSQLNQSVKQLLEQQMGQIYLTGEISNFSQPSSGHWYFSLKDQQAQVRCAMFRNSNLRTSFRPANGQQVMVRCQVTLYEPRGDYQLIADQMQPAGDGLLQLQFAQLKQRLAAEGLFASEHKKPLPSTIRQIGIITSASGAALQDMLTILRRRDASLSVIIYPTVVQGNQAAPQIAKTIQLANQRQECDVLIVGRGGGSLEDLACFNDEQLARTIFASQIPIISAVGHETDVTIADFVSDLRAPTPSAAAELVSQDRKVIMQQLVRQQQRLCQSFDYLLMHRQQRHSQLQHRLLQQHPQLRLQRQQQQLQRYQQQLQQACQSIIHNKQRQLNQQQQRCYLASPQRQVVQYQQRCQHAIYQLSSAYQQILHQRQQRFAASLHQLQAISPLATLSRGYSIAQNSQQQTIKSVQQLKLQQVIRLQFSDGSVSSQITHIDAVHD